MRQARKSTSPTNDIFNWNKEDNYFYSPYYVSYSSYRYNSRYVSIEAIYRFSSL